MVEIQQAVSAAHLKGILELQKANLKEHLPLSVRTKEGFLTLKHSFDILTEMNELLPHIIALDQGKVVGYALSMVKEMRDRVPALHPMFEKIDQLTYKGHPLAAASYYIMGQVCVDAGYRGKGLFRALYEYHRTAYIQKFDYFLTEVSNSNVRSLKAHQKIGFQTITAYEDDSDHWHLILWDWTSRY